MTARGLQLRLLLIGLLVTFFCLTGSGLDQTEIDWIAAHALPLTSTEDLGLYDDLLPLRESLSDAKLVGLGEGTHGTREFFTLRLRMLEFLAAELGFTEFMFEFPYEEGRLLDKYVQTGEGDPAAVLARVYCTPWNHQEMLDTIEWMRSWNRQGGARRVSFHGVDIHDGDARLLIDPILEQIARSHPSSLAQFEERLKVFYYPSMYHAVAFIDADGTGREDLAWVESELRTKRGTYAAGMSGSEYNSLLDGMKMLRQRAEYFATNAADPVRGNDLRDRYMAENVLEVLREAGSNARGTYAGHNYHVARFEDQAMPSGPSTVHTTSAGYHLSIELGDAYVVFATTTRRGEAAVFAFPGDDIGEQYQILPIPSIAYAGHATLLRAVGIPAFVLDLRQATAEQEGTDWMYEDNPWLSFGTTYFPGMRSSYTIYTPLAPAFDLVAYIETTTPPTMMDWVPKHEL